VKGDRSGWTQTKLTIIIEAVVDPTS